MSPRARACSVVCLALAASCADSPPAVLGSTADVVLPDVPSVDGGGPDARADDVPEVRDATRDAALDATLDVFDATALDVAEAPDVAPDVARDVAPELAVDAPEVAMPVDAGTIPTWARNVGDRGNDIVEDIALDAAGNVFVVGRLGAPAGSPANDDMLVASFGPDGRPRWSRRFGGGANDGARGVAVDRAGNVYVTGYFGDSVDLGGGPLGSAGGLDGVVASFTGEGVHRWSRRFGGRYGDNGASVATDPDGNVYLAAVITDDTDLGGAALRPPRDASPGLVVASLTADGAHRWSRVMGGRYTSVTARLATAPDGDVLVTGSFNYAIDPGGGLLEGHAGTDGFVARLAPDGAHRWSQNYGGNSTIAVLAPERVAADGEGNVYATGTLNGTVGFVGATTRTGNFDPFLLSLRPDGQFRWAAAYPGAETDRALGLAVQPSGRVIITGFVSRAVDFGGGPVTSAGSYDLFVASFSAAGAHRWSRRFGTASYEESRAVAVDELGGVYLAGTFRAPLDLGGTTITPAGSDDGFVGRFLPE